VTLATLLLADGRFPVGSHAHSAGVEAACADGHITGESTLAEFLDGRLRTAGLSDAALAATAHLALAPFAAPGADEPGIMEALDAEAEARIAVPSWRAASRRLGRQLVRVGRRCWPSDVLGCLAGTLPHGPHQPLALGAVGVAARCDVVEVARLAVHHVLTTPAQAAVRLLGLDPFAVAALTAQLSPVAEQVAADAVVAARSAVAADLGNLADLPALSSPLVEIAAADHASWEVRMFAT
jgi:urease accessory protein